MGPSQQSVPKHRGSRFAGARHPTPSDRCYELRLEVDVFHRNPRSRSAWASSGRTLSWRRDRILLATDRPIGTASRIEMIIRWSPSVQLVVPGQVLRHEPRGAVVRIERRRSRGFSNGRARGAGAGALESPIWN